MATPQTLDVLSRFLADAFDESIYLNQPTAFQRFFGRPGSFSHFSPNANDFDYEVTRNNEGTAVLAPRGTMASFLNLTSGQVGQSTYFSRKYPLAVVEATIGADQINNRFVPGEGSFEGLSREIRLQRYAVRAYKIILQYMERLFERLAVQSITLGKQSGTVLGTPGTSDYDFRRNSGNSITLTHSWGNASGVPLTDLDTACQQVRSVGHLVPDFCILGATAFNNLLFNAQLMSSSTYPTGGYASQIYYNYVQFNMNFKPDAKFDEFVACGLTPQGKIHTPSGYELTVFTYAMQGYNDPLNSNTWTKYLNDIYAVIGSTKARADRFFGPPEQLPLTALDQQRLMERFGFNPLLPPLPVSKWQDGDVIAPQMFYIDAYEGTSRENLTLRAQAAPVFVTTQTDAFVTLLNAGGTG